MNSNRFEIKDIVMSPVTISCIIIKTGEGGERLKKSILPILVAGLMVLIGASACFTAGATYAEPKIEFSLNPAWGTLFGTVDYPDGSPAQGANVIASHHIIDIFLHNESWYPYYDQTDESGHYSIDLPPGDYFIFAFKILGQRGWAAQTSIVVGEGEQKEVSMTLRTIFGDQMVANQQMPSSPTNS